MHSGEIEGHDQKSEMSKVIAKRWHELDDETKAAYVAVRHAALAVLFG